ncbi:MAG: glycosyltransferase [Candidatus Omnitrophica bacterium]|nr:glycosyltransferase [Candidatus Omnitrophota bacterium]
MSQPYVSVIIPTYNREEPLCQTLQSIFNQTFSNLEIIVVDQTPQHDSKTISFLEANKNRIRYYTLDRQNFPGAKNFGASLAKGEILLFCDDDMLFDKEFLKYHIENYADPKVDGVVSRLIVLGKQKRPFTLFRIKHVGAWCALSGRSFSNWDYDQRVFISYCFAGPVISLRKTIFFKSGGFDTSFIAPFIKEDLDFGYRLKKLGARIIYEPKAVAFHQFWPTGGCRQPDPIKSEYARFHNTIIFYLKNMPKLFLPYMLAVFFLIGIKKILIPTRSIKKFLYVLSGLFDGYRVYLKKDNFKNRDLRIAFVSNFCFHFKKRFFELLTKNYNIDFFFFGGDMNPAAISRDTSNLWNKKLNFNATFLNGFYLMKNLRVTPSLVYRLIRGNYDIFIKCHNGRVALPVTFLLAKLLNRPFILYTNFWFHPTTWFHRLSYPIMKFIYRHSDALYAGGDHVRAYLISLGVRKEKIFVYYNVVDNALFNRQVSAEEIKALKGKLGISDKKVILFVGRLVKEKGLEYLLRAFADMNHVDAALVIVGEGGDEELLKKIISRIKIENVIFTGYIPNDLLYRYYAIADIFVLPSIKTDKSRESWGVVINEAMNQGLPIIVTEEVGSARSGLVRHGVNGFIVPSRDHFALRSAMEKLLLNEEMRRRFGDSSRQMIKDWSYEEKMLKGFASAIEYVLAKKNR